MDDYTVERVDAFTFIPHTGPDYSADEIVLIFPDSDPLWRRVISFSQTEIDERVVFPARRELMAITLDTESSKIFMFGGQKIR